MSAHSPDDSTLLLAGPTASGKSAVALLLAEQLGGEIVTVDSMQVYRGMDVGTAKPAPADRGRVPHHLLDIAEPGEAFNAACFLARAEEAVRSIHQRHRTAVLCGGTGLYFKAWMDGLGETPAPDAELRLSLEQLPNEELVREIELGDPVTAAGINPRDRRRLIRAVEVLRGSGRPPATQRAPWRRAGAAPFTANADAGCHAGHGGHLICLDRASDDLRARIDARVEAMFTGGLLEETQRLLELALPEESTCLQALGYRQVLAHLRGQCSLEETVTEVKLRTWRFAKRQRTWFRHQADPLWLMIPAGEPAEATARRVEEAWRARVRT